MNTGIRIKELRKSKRLTQRELASKINVSSQVVSNWERAYSTPDIKDAKRLADALETSVDNIIGVGLPMDTEIAEETKLIGVEAIKLIADLIKNGLTREQLVDFLEAIKNIQGNKK